MDLHTTSVWSVLSGILRKWSSQPSRRGSRTYHCRLRFEQCEDRRMLAMFMVTNNADAPENTPAAVGTLRQAIFDANQLDDLDTIDFSTNAADGLNGGTINLSNSFSLRTLSITNSVTINASMLTGGLTINAGGGTDGAVGNGDGIAVFSIESPREPRDRFDITLAGLTITGGDAGASLFTADGDDDGDVDADDYTIWTQNFGHTLELLDIVS